jgi:uncharacterized protein YqhQ
MDEGPARVYGGQAVVEGVMMRGPKAVAVAVRRPDGEIVSYSERLSGVFTTRLRTVLLVRGVAVLVESLTLGARALNWSSAVASEEVDGRDGADRLGLSGLLSLLITLGVASVVFFLGPVLATFWLDGPLGSAWWSLLIESGLRLVLLIGYVWVIGQAEEIQRIFQYHAAEHQTIHAYEHGAELSVPAIRRQPPEHPRCGTSFLLTVAMVSALVFIFVGTEPLWWRFASRLVLIPLVAGIAYEAIRFGGLHEHWPVVRSLFVANLALQRLTTRTPDDEQMQVALEAFRRVRATEDEGDPKVS